MEFAQMLREAMGELTQEQLAAASGVSQANISKYLRGTEPKVSQLDALEQALPQLQAMRTARRRERVKVSITQRFPDMLREALDGLSQGEVSERTGISQAAISRYLLGQRTPGLAHLDALERAFPRLRELRAAQGGSAAA